MKTKKISWQAIAIVALALVLIVSVALGVSGAWFQDSDNASTEATLGEAVTIRLADTTNNENAPKTWTSTYKSTEKAYPGDIILGSTSIVPGSATPSLFRIKITPTATGTGYNKDQTTAPDVVTKPAEGEDTTAYDTYMKNYNSYLINTMFSKLNLTGWTVGAKTDADATGYFYYDSINAATTAIKLFDELKLSTELTNEAATWTISVTIEVEAIQAANISENAEWYGDLPTALKTTVNTHNTDRLQTAA